MSRWVSCRQVLSGQRTHGTRSFSHSINTHILYPPFPVRRIKPNRVVSSPDREKKKKRKQKEKKRDFLSSFVRAPFLFSKRVAVPITHTHTIFRTGLSYLFSSRETAINYAEPVSPSHKTRFTRLSRAKGFSFLFFLKRGDTRMWRAVNNKRKALILFLFYYLKRTTVRCKQFFSLPTQDGRPSYQLRGGI